jgi:hypothetical protein
MVLQAVDDKLMELLKDSWDKSNTSQATPKFLKITDIDSKIYDFNTNKAVVIIQRPLYRNEKNGVGADSKRLRHTVRVDLRVLGKDCEALFVEMYNELIRILDAHIIAPFSGFNELDYEDQNHTDLSDRSKGLFRIIVPVVAINYCVARGN